uniref:NADH-ubiquinone oxidoreductase chain 2 n=1 Tax=Cociella crocodilus TaxID=2792426 RepID=A0A5J6CX57_9TELE|nr:NADH dehydrogenase subunit 2 [Cociella crocodilus]QEQ55513.1 NADH dehydrogenase subunit 2 [Cociella crocodilus]
MNSGITALLMLTLVSGTHITFTSSHWLMAWMGLELNTIAILPLMAKYHHPRATEATTKYFLTQATGAAILLFATLTDAWIQGHWAVIYSMNPLTTNIMALALALKLGMAPMHFWLPEVLQGVDLTTGLILSTWQKLAPFILLVQIQNINPTLPVLIALTSILVGGWGGLNQTQLRKVLAYSSIAHLGWMMLVMMYSPTLAILSLFMYIIMTTSAFLMFKLFSVTSLNALSTSWSKYPLLTALAPLILLSLAGLPPLSGFMPKWFILAELSKQSLAIPATVAALSALLSLFFYLRIAYALSLTIFPTNSTTILFYHPATPSIALPLAASTMAALGLLPLAPILIALWAYW